ncbi:MAG: L-threonylcarbamoyladenylate synthase [Pseudomonadales bacterium]
MTSPSTPIQQAVAAIRAGGVIAYPTEAVWGLGCDPHNLDAVEKLLAIKQRSMAKGLILVAANIEQLKPFFGEMTADQYRLLQANWPGFTTFIVPASPQVPQWIKGDFDSIALRVSAHPLVRELCEAFAGPLVSTSANLSGQSPAQSFDQVVKTFSTKVDFVLPGNLGDASKPSPIIDIHSGQVLR